MTGTEKKYLRGLAHGLKPVVRIGRKGLTEAVIGSLDEALESHELIKVKIDAERQERPLIGAEIDARLGSVQVGAIGRVAIFYRRASDPEKRKVRFPS